MNRNMLNQSSLIKSPQLPSPFPTISAKLTTPTSSISSSYNDHLTSEGPAVKQTWDEFCKEQSRLKAVRPSTLSASNSRSFSSILPDNWWQAPHKRPLIQDMYDREPMLKTSKKRKKPLSHNVPPKKEWPIAEAERAIASERECNKRSKTALIIKFPDLELNRDIVAGFHPGIENVHFQQPSTPRFCFVTLKNTANAEEVIEFLNRYRFGDSYLIAEHKKDREEDLTVNARDIDPYTLYVGNLAQEITKEDMVQLYPNSRRIDIGYAKKMKYTRYAFVVFHTTDAALESFIRTHNHQIYNKSLIVRFRRLHGTVGMPGDTKQQNPPKQPTSDHLPNSQTSSEDCVEIENENNCVTPFMINVKQELQPDTDYEDDYNDDEDMPDVNLSNHPKSIKLEVKSEVQPEVYEYAPDTKVGIKSELKREHKFIDPEFNEYYDEELEPECDYYAQEDDFEEMYQNFANQRKQASNLRSTMF